MPDIDNRRHQKPEIPENTMEKRHEKSGISWVRGRVKVAVCLLFAFLVLALVIVNLVAAAPEEAAAASPANTITRPPTLVQYSVARELTFYDSISADGEIKSRFYSLVSPRINGIVDNIFVREGDRVEQGRTELFRIDNEKLQQAVDHARQSLVIARSTLDERKANLRKAKADLAQSQKDYDRGKALYEQKVVPLAEFEMNETKLLQIEAQVEVEETNVILAEQNVALSEIALRMNETNLRDSVMYAPITGVVSARYSEPGEMGAPGKSIIRLEDTENLKAVAYLPGQFFPRIAPGSSIAAVHALGKKIGEFPISYKAPGIDSALRTFETWADIPGDGEYAVYGAQCVLTIILNERPGTGVPRDAIQYRDGKYWIFMPDGETAKMIEVEPGLETDGWTELLNPPLKAGDRVITQGQFLLEDGYPIRERGE